MLPNICGLFIFGLVKCTHSIYSKLISHLQLIGLINCSNLQDGRLQVRDRLLAIDNRPLSCLSSSNALCLLKSSISRITTEGEPFVRLLVARRIHGVDEKEPLPPQPTEADVLSRHVTGLENSKNCKRGEGGNSGSLDSLVRGILEKKPPNRALVFSLILQV